MDHSFFKDRLSAYFDNELPAQEKQVVEEHLQSCAECRAELAKLQQLEDAVNRHAELSDSEYWEKSARKIESRLGFEQPTAVTPVHRKWYERGLGWKALAAAASIGVMAYIGINSDKILKPRDLEPQLSPSPAVKTVDQLVNDRVDSTPVISTPAEQKDRFAQPTTGDKNAAPERDVAVEPTRTKPIELSKTKVSPALERIQPIQDVDLATPQPQETAANNTSQSESQVVTVAIPEQRAAVAPSALVADSSRPIADEFVGKFEVTSKETTIAQIDTAVSDTMLTWWRKKRDELLAVQKSLPGVDAFSDLRKMAAPTALKQTERRAPQMTRPEVEKQLLEAWFNTAKLTKDTNERASAVIEIRRVVDNQKSPNRELAAGYLKQLTAQ